MVHSSVALAVAVDEAVVSVVFMLDASSSGAFELDFPVACFGPAVSSLCIFFGDFYSMFLYFFDECVEVVFVVL